MARLVFDLLLLAMQYAILNCTKHNVNVVYRPYGIAMCKRLCNSSTDVFYFVEKCLSCCRINPSDLTDDTEKCPLLTGLDVCNREFGGSGQTSEAYQALATEAVPDLDLLLKQPNRNITLHQACEEGKLVVVKYILSQGLEDINCCGKAGRTPVMAAARYGQVKVFEYLVSQGCYLSAVSIYNSTVLHYACISGNTEIVRILIDNGTCDIESIGSCGRKPIMYTALYGHMDVFELLVENGCDLLVTDKNKDNILHLAVQGGHVEMVQHILSHTSVSMESRGSKGMTPLLTAARHGKTMVFHLLARKGCKVQSVDDLKNNILHVACIGGYVDMVRHILSLNIVSTESRGFKGWTPVLIAATCGKIKVFDFLVRKGCKVKAIDSQKNNILHVACIGGYADMVRRIVSLNIVSIESRNIVGRTPVLTAAKYGKIKVFDFLVGKGCKTNVVTDYKYNILHLACYGGYVDMVRHILSLNIVSIESRTSSGRTPLMVAAQNGRKEVFDFLVKKGGKITSVDGKKNNVLSLACLGGHVDMVKYLLTGGAVKGMEKAKNKHGDTPLQLADKKGFAAVVRLLLDWK